MNSANNGVRKMEFSSLGGTWDGEYNGTSFVEITNISVTHDDIFVEKVPFDGVYFDSACIKRAPCAIPSSASCVVKGCVAT